MMTPGSIEKGHSGRRAGPDEDPTREALGHSPHEERALQTDGVGQGREAQTTHRAEYPGGNKTPGEAAASPPPEGRLFQELTYLPTHRATQYHNNYLKL